MDDATCPGPFIWYDADDGGGAVLECSACGHITVTGNFHEARHADTPLLTEGLAS